MFFNKIEDFKDIEWRKNYLISYEADDGIMHAYFFKEKDGIEIYVNFKEGYNFSNYNGQLFKDTYDYIRKNNLHRISSIKIGNDY